LATEQAAAFGRSRKLRATFSQFSISALTIVRTPARDRVVARGLKDLLHKKFEHPRQHLFPPVKPMLEARQTLHRRPALFSAHLGNERFHVLDAFGAPLDVRAKLLLDKCGGKLAQLEISREVVATSQSSAEN
jgi:hypothetical protein